MQAIILAAGMGRRLGEWTRDNTKCMLPVNGVRLIDRVLRQLSKLDINRVIIVVGYKGQNVIEHIGHRYDNDFTIEFYDNPIYDKTNNIYSLSLVKDKMMEDDTLLIESDLIVSDEMFDLIVNDPYPNLALVAKYETWMDGTMVRIDNENNIVNFVPKQAFRYDDAHLYYKTVNIYKFSKLFSTNQYVPFLDAYVKALGCNEYYEQVLRVITLISNSELKAKPIGSLPWYEIDDVQDKDIAETIFADEKDKFDKYTKRHGGYWRFEHVMDFSNLMNPFFPPQKMKDEIRANFDRLLTEYPSGLFINSLLAGKYFNVREECMVLGNGTAELIKCLMNVLEGKIGVVFPTIEEYLLTKRSEDIIRFMSSEHDYVYTADDLISYYTNKDIKTLLLMNPDNPSGNYIHEDEVIRLIAWCKENGMMIIVDESFVDFVDDTTENRSLIKNRILQAHDNLIVVRSISDSYGIAGIRLGVLASSNINIVRNIMKQVSLWNINSFAEFYMQIFNKYEKDYKHACVKVKMERDWLYSQLSNIDFLSTIPSQANFILCKVSCRYSSRELSDIMLNRFNILIKNCDTKIGLEGSELVRFTVRNRIDNAKLVEALKTL